MLSTLCLLTTCLAAPLPLGADGWTFSPGAEFPGAKGSLAVDGQDVVLNYDFTGGGAYVAAYRAFDPVQASSVTLSIKKPAEGEMTFRVVDSSDQSLQKSIHFGAEDWQQVEVLNSGWTGHWGGANDGRVHGGLRSFGVLIEGKSLKTKVGAVRLRAVTVQSGATPSPSLLTSTYQATDFHSLWGAWGAGRLEDGVWTYQLSNAAKSATIGTSISLHGKPQSLTFRGTGGLAGQKLILRLGSHFQTFQRELGTLTGGAVEFSAPLPPAKGWTWFGGENDGNVHPPLRLASLIVEGPTGAETSLRGLSIDVTTEIQRRDALILAPAPARAAGDQVAWQADLLSLLPEATPARATLRLSRWDGTPLGEQSFDLNLKPGQRASLTADQVAEKGCALGQWSVSGGSAVASAEAAWVPPVAPAAPGTKAEPASPWGMGIYLYRYGNDARSLAEMDKAAALAAAAGIKWTREEFQWHRLEPTEGQYDWSFYDNMVATAQRHGISIYGLLAYWTGWSKSYTEEGCDQYCRWAKAVVSRYKDRIHHWEVWNEPNIFFWSGPKELYPKLLAKAYAAIKEADPTATVLGCSTAGIDMAFIKRCVDAKAPFDVLTVHPYRGTLAESGFIDELRRASKLAGDKPVWITEMGWPTQFGGGVAESDQARLLARCYLSAVGSGAVPNMSWYNYRDDGTDPFYNEAKFGIIRRDFSPKPAYRALATIAGTLTGAHDGQQIDLGPGLWCFRYRTTQGTAWSLWSDATQLVDLTVDAAASAVGLLGDKSAAAGQRLLQAGTPLLITASERLAVRPAPWSIVAPSSARPGTTFTVSLTGAAPAGARLTLTGDGLKPAGQSAGALTVQVAVPADMPAGPQRIGAQVAIGEHVLVWPLSIEILPSWVRG